MTPNERREIFKKMTPDERLDAEKLLGDTEDILTPDGAENVPVRWRFWLFFSSPQVIFTTHTISFFIFLYLFGYILIMDYNPRPSNLEWIMLFWVFTFVCEEIRQIVEVNEDNSEKKTPSVFKKSSTKKTRLHKIVIGLREWFRDSWNWP